MGREKINDYHWYTKCYAEYLTLQTDSKGGGGFLLRHKLDNVHATFLRNMICGIVKATGSKSSVTTLYQIKISIFEYPITTKSAQPNKVPPFF